MIVEPTYVLRDATVEDAEHIAEIYAEAARGGQALMLEELLTAKGLERLIKSFGRRETIMVLEGGHQVFGWGVIRRHRDQEAFRFSCEVLVCQSLKLAGRGYGMYLKRALIERCRDYGYRHLVTQIPADQQESIDDNLQLGFERVGLQKQVAYVNGQFQDVALLQLVLHDVPAKIPEKYL